MGRTAMPELAHLQRAAVRGEGLVPGAAAVGLRHRQRAAERQGRRLGQRQLLRQRREGPCGLRLGLRRIPVEPISSRSN